MENHPNYYAVITAEVRYDKDLEPNAKLLYGEISALANRDGYCWATNEYFSALYDVDVRTVGRWLESLEEKGYIHREVTKQGFKTVRKIWINHGLKKFLRQDKNAPFDKGENVPLYKVNNTKNNTKKKGSSSSPKKKFAAASSDWKKEYDSDDLKKAKAMLKRKGNVKNEEGWLRDCLKYRWFEEEEKLLNEKEKQIERHRSLAQKIEASTVDKLKPGCTLAATRTTLLFHSGMKTYSFDYSLSDFEEKVKKQLEQWGLSLHD